MDLPVVLITGCSTGIGKALALEFASRNTFVFASARKLASIKELKESKFFFVFKD
jgi:1-acylglycerone phosphate reductase